MTRTRAIAICGLCFTTALFASSIAAPAGSQTPAPALSAQDKNFLIRAWRGGILQLSLGRVAGAQAETAGIRQFATGGTENFAKADMQLRSLAAQSRVELPPSIPPDIERLRQGLAADRGGIVDEEYLAQTLPATMVAINLFKDEAQHGADFGVVQFARNMLPQLEARRDMAEHLVRLMGGLVAGEPPLKPMTLPPEAPLQTNLRQAAEERHG